MCMHRACPSHARPRPVVSLTLEARYNVRHGLGIRRGRTRSTREARGSPF